MQVAEGGAQLLTFKSSALLASSAQASPHLLFLSCLWPGTDCRRTDAALCSHHDANPSDAGPQSIECSWGIYVALLGRVSDGFMIEVTDSSSVLQWL